MTFSKRSLSLTALILGITLFASAALADLVIGSGYTQLKDAVKTTSKYATTMDDFTFRAEMEVRLDGETLVSAQNRSAMDIDNNISVSWSTSREADNGDRSTFYEYDSTTMYNFNTKERLSWNNDDRRYNSVSEQVYYLTTNAYGTNPRPYSYDPFQDPVMEDLEKVFDALVGSLSSLVQVSNHGEGKEFSGSLNEAQVPMLIQALTTYVVKEASGAYSNDPEWEDYSRLPFSKDARIDTVNGRALTNAEGVLTELSGDVRLTGLDRHGNEHSIELDVVLFLEEIGSTTVEWPSLEGKNVEEQQGSYYEDIRASGQIMAEREAGIYRANIVLDDGEQYVKVGERWLELEVTATEVKGRYGETFLPGYEQIDPNAVGELSFTIFNGVTTEEMTDVEDAMTVAMGFGRSYSVDGSFTAIDSQGRERTGYLDLWSHAAAMYLNIDPIEHYTENIQYQNLQRVFD